MKPTTKRTGRGVRLDEYCSDCNTMCSHFLYELEEIKPIKGRIYWQIQCEFCGTDAGFDPERAEKILKHYLAEMEQE